MARGNLDPSRYRSGAVPYLDPTLEILMQRRTFLELAATAGLTAGCDRLVVVDPRESVEIPAVSPNGDFYRYQYDGRPSFDAATHLMRVQDGDQLLTQFGRSFLASLDPMETEQTLQCIGSNPRVQRISNAVWTGLPLIDVFDALEVQVPDDAVGMRLVGMDDYTAGIPIEDLYDAPVWLMWGMNGETLPFAHGAPARLLVRGKYGMKALKWIREMAFVREPHESYWTQFGWDEEAPYLPNTLIASPIDGVGLDGDGAVRIVGTAFAGEDPVVAVDYRVDDGPWMPAELDYATGLPGIWVLWAFTWQPVRGRHTLQVRCTTQSGATSVDDPEGTDRLLGYDGSMAITVRA